MTLLRVFSLRFQNKFVFLNRLQTQAKIFACFLIWAEIDAVDLLDHHHNYHWSSKLWEQTI